MESRLSLDQERETAVVLVFQARCLKHFSEYRKSSRQFAADKDHEIPLW